MNNLRGVDFDGGNALASSGGFVMPNFFFQAWGIPCPTLEYDLRITNDTKKNIYIYDILIYYIILY